ncbi:trigger factor [Simkania negevensis]|uniref:Trigger factor n=1 Tax=Simkania negevensis TaxID=83561 RepID=A0ABS3AT59_9BACT|nr:trigger factor [Simkania negevensis]
MSEQEAGEGREQGEAVIQEEPSVEGLLPPVEEQPVEGQIVPEPEVPSDVKTSTFSDSHAEVTLHESPGCSVKMEIHLTPVAEKKTYDEAVKKINKAVSLPGFRKGRAPKQLVVNHFEKHINDEWKEGVVSFALHKGLELAHLLPFQPKQIKTYGKRVFNLEEGSSVAFEFERRPHIPSIDYDAVSLEKKEIEEPSQEDVDAALLRAQKYCASWEDVDPRPVEDGDYAIVTLKKLDEEDEGARLIFDEEQLKLDREEIAPWVYDLVIGLQPGEEREGKMELSAEEQEGSDEKSKKEPSPCRVIVHRIEKQLLPEVDDEFAKKLGADSVEALLDRIRQGLLKEKEANRKRQYEEEMTDWLLSNHDVDLPLSLLEDEQSHRMKTRIQEFKNKGLSKEEIEEKKEEIQTHAHYEARKALKLFFLSAKVAHDAEVEVTKEDLNSAFVQRCATLGLTPSMFASQNTLKDELMNHLEYETRLTKVMEYLVERALAKAS